MGDILNDFRLTFFLQPPIEAGYKFLIASCCNSSPEPKLGALRATHSPSALQWDMGQQQLPRDQGARMGWEDSRACIQTPSKACWVLLGHTAQCHGNPNVVAVMRLAQDIWGKEFPIWIMFSTCDTEQSVQWFVLRSLCMAVLSHTPV